MNGHSGPNAPGDTDYRASAPAQPAPVDQGPAPSTPLRPPGGTTNPRSEQGPSFARPLAVANGIVLTVVVVCALALLALRLHSDKKTPPHHGTSTTVVAGSSTTSAPTTTAPIPTSPTPTAQDAAAALVSDWASADRPAALQVADPVAVATLFAAPYQRGLAIARGCSVAFEPLVCTYGPPGGASPTDPIYEIYVSKAPQGWYVSSVKLEN